MARKPFWEDSALDFTVADDADSLTSLVGGLSEDERRGMTIIRTIVAIQIAPFVTSGVVGTMSVDLAIGNVNQQAFTAGAGSMPDPVINSERPPRGWIWKTRTAVVDDATTAMPLTFINADIRSKRKVDAMIPYLHVAPFSRSGTEFTIKVSGLIRVLYLLA